MRRLNIRRSSSAVPHCSRQVPRLKVRTGFHHSAASYTATDWYIHQPNIAANSAGTRYFSSQL